MTSRSNKRVPPSWLLPLAMIAAWCGGDMSVQGQVFRPGPRTAVRQPPVAPAAQYFQAIAPTPQQPFHRQRPQLDKQQVFEGPSQPANLPHPGDVRPIQYLNDLAPNSNQVVTAVTSADSPVLDSAHGSTANSRVASLPTLQPGPLSLLLETPATQPATATLVPGPLAPSTTNNGIAGSLGGTAFLLAEQPRADGRFQYSPPGMSNGASLVDYSPYDFSSDQECWEAYDPYAQQDVYMGKTLNRTQRPLVEWFKPWYQRGQIKPGNTWFGTHNPIIPQFLVYGDYRTAWASNTANGNNFSVWAHRLNLDFDFRLTSTERVHWFMTPLSRGPNFTRLLHDGDPTFISELNPDVIFGYFEGDLGAMWGGVTNKSMPFDLPFAIGVMPLLFQNGVWLEDAFLGVAATIPARNSPKLDISNMDTTFFVGFDNVSSPAFNNENSAANLYGVANFIEAWGGYMELDYAYLEDNRILNRSYHNTSVAFTRRFGTWLSNSVRVINNSGQNPNGIAQTADGTLLLVENSLITAYPSTRIPYFNFFAGFDRPQSAARDPLSGGVLRNTGILFETDGLTGYPFLDDTANNTFGGAVGLNLLADDFSQQLVLETAAVMPMEGKVSQAGDPQYGVGLRYQIPLTNSVILRSDAMYGMRESQDDLHGIRVELRKKW
ncbi:MAG: hypothetical protein Q8M16_03315 [Pirellulaceae bacterium]|nr:hypothetical protein [Pirellulaceae bacterium]